MQLNRYSPLKVLLIEDNVGDAILAKEALANSAISNDVSIANDGQMAMDMLNGKPGCEYLKPDVIFLDLDLPKKSGIQVLTEIKLNKSLKKIPVMVYSKSNYSQDIHEAYCLKIDNYIIKPLDSGDIFSDQQIKTQELMDGMLEYTMLEKGYNDIQDLDCNDIMKYVSEKAFSNALYKGSRISYDELPIINQCPMRIMVLFYNMIKISLDFHVSNFLSSKIHLTCNKTELEWIFTIQNIENNSSLRKEIVQPFHKLFNKNNHGIENMHMSLCQKIINELNARFWVEEGLKNNVILNYAIPISSKAQIAESDPQQYYDNYLI